MRGHWLSTIPLLTGVALCVLSSLAPNGQSKRRAPVVWLSLVTALICAGIAWNLPPNQVTSFLGQQWVLSPAAQTLLASLSAATALLIAVAYRTPQVEPFCGPALTSFGLLAAAMLLQPQALSFALLSAALVILTLAATADRPSVRGASRLLGLATLPIPCVVLCFALLDRLALFPDQPALAELSSVLVIPCVALWLTLFPFQGTTPLWAKRQVPLAPAFLWIVKDWVVVWLLLALWTRFPALRTEPTALALGILGLFTAVVSGIWAAFQMDLSAVLACAAMSELGIAIQGLVAGSPAGLQSALLLLSGRAFAILLATSALAALGTAPDPPSTELPAPGGHARWWAMLPLAAFSVGVMSLAGAPPLLGFVGRQQLYVALRAQNPSVVWAWLPAALGLVAGLIRSLRTAWRAAQVTQTPQGSSRFTLGARNLPSLVAMCLLVLCLLWLRLQPQPLLDLIFDLAEPWMPTFTL